MRKISLAAATLATLLVAGVGATTVLADHTRSHARMRARNQGIVLMAFPPAKNAGL